MAQGTTFYYLADIELIKFLLAENQLEKIDKCWREQLMSEVTSIALTTVSTIYFLDFSPAI